jgi:antitoxin VapB
MALNDRNWETEQLAAELASLTGEAKAEAVRKALAERLGRIRRTRGKRRLVEEIDEIADHCASLPLLDNRSADEILGYDANGLPSDADPSQCATSTC